MTLHQVVTSRLAEMGETAYTLRAKVDPSVYGVLYRVINRLTHRITDPTRRKLAGALKLDPSELDPFITQVGVAYNRKRRKKRKRKCGNGQSIAMKKRWAKLKELDSPRQNENGTYLVLNSATGQIVARF